jgi:hypothetical protein
MEDLWAIVVVIAAVVVLFILLIVVRRVCQLLPLVDPVVLTGAGITIWDLIGMTFRKVNAATIVKSKIMAVPPVSIDRGRSPPRPWRRTTWPAATCRW